MSDFADTQIIPRPSVYGLTMRASELVSKGSEGFDTDAEFDAWMTECKAWMDQSGDKFIACRAVIERAEAEEQFLKAEAAKLVDRARKFASVQSRVKDLAKALIEAQVAVGGAPKVQTADGSTVSLVTRKDVQVSIADANDLPTSFVRVKVEPDLVKIKAAFKAGEQVAGAVCAEVESTSLRWGK